MTSQPNKLQHIERHLVITVHGIQTYGHWQERLETLLKRREPNITVYNYKYGYFSLAAFLVPFLRWIVTRRFRIALLQTVRATSWDRIDIVAHSFGTHIVGWGLYGIPEGQRPQINTIIFSGSVLKPEFPWLDLRQTCVHRVVNECGNLDLALLGSQIVVLFTGMAGRVGFGGMTDENFRNRFFNFRHSDYFYNSGRPSDSFIRRYWVPLLTRDTPIPPFDCRLPLTVFNHVTNFILNNIEPIKFVTYLTPIVLLALWFLSLYLEADYQRRIAFARQLSTQAELVRGNQGESLNVSVLLAIESLRGQFTPEAEQVLLRGLALLPRLLLKTTYVKHIESVAFSPDSKYLATAAADGTVKIWEIKTGKELNQLIHKDQVSHIAFSPNGRFIATASFDQTARIWEPLSGTEIAAIRHESKALAVAFSPSSQYLATQSQTGIIIWDMKRNERVAQIAQNIYPRLLPNKVMSFSSRRGRA